MGKKHSNKHLLSALSSSVGQHITCHHVLPPENLGQKPVGRSRGIDFMGVGDSKIGGRNRGSVVEIKARGCSWTRKIYVHSSTPRKSNLPPCIWVAPCKIEPNKKHENKTTGTTKNNINFNVCLCPAWHPKRGHDPVSSLQKSTV